MSGGDSSLANQALASLYLGQFTPSFWRWSDDGEAIVWSSGETIVLRAELEELLVRLAHRGLPSLSAVVLVLAACRDVWKDPATTAERRLLSRFPGSKGRAAFRNQLDTIWRAMESISSLPAELRQGVEAKTVLLEAVLETADLRLSPEEAEGVAQVLGEGVSPAAPGGLVEWAPPSLYELGEDLIAIERGTRSLDAQALARRARTGVEADLAAADVELPDSERVRGLLARLKEDEELAGVARLALDLLAAVHVPRPVSARGDQPLGGVSDIANRGPLHRLLLSELAHDPLAFTVRIATGEALYLRRETPPRRPPNERVILLDAGIRTWGVARLFLTSLGLALVASAGEASVVVYRAEDGALVPVDLLTREGLVEHLEALHVSAHPGRALARLLERGEEVCGEGKDLVVVSQLDALHDPAFLAELAGRSAYLAGVTASGSYQLELHSPRGRRVISQAQLALSSVFDPVGPPMLGEPVWDEGGPGSPAILSGPAFPFLLPARLDPRRLTSHPILGTVAVTGDGRLMHWARRDQGGKQLTAQVPKGTLHWLEVDDSGLARAAVHQPGLGRLVVLSADLERGAVRSAVVQSVDASLLAVARVGGVLALIHGGHVDGVVLSTGARLDPVGVGGQVSWVQGRFFRRQEPGSWEALAWDGGRLHLLPVPTRGLPVQALWDRAGTDGPWALLPDGSVLSLAQTDERPFMWSGGPVAPLAFSRDGHRLIVEDVAGARIFLDLESASERTVRERLYHHALQPEALELALQAPQLRRRFQSIGVDSRGRLALVSRRGRTVPLRIDAKGRLVLGPGEPGERMTMLRSFVPADAPATVRYRLELATWPGGSQAWLDSRGLLHLRSASSNVPELTLVLRDQGPLAAWVSTGVTAGPAYFLGRERADASSVIQALGHFLAAL